MSIQIGDFIFSWTIIGSIFIERASGPNEGEGMEVSLSSFNDLFDKYFKENM